MQLLQRRKERLKLVLKKKIKCQKTFELKDPIKNRLPATSAATLTASTGVATSTGSKQKCSRMFITFCTAIHDSNKINYQQLPQ
jgi:c-di-GMP-binding flagellar brake protein YcgR